MATQDSQVDLQQAVLPDDQVSVAPTLVAPADVAPKGAAKEDTSFGHFLSLWKNSDSTGNSLARFAAEGQIVDDPNFRVEDLNEDDKKFLFDGLPQKTVDNLFYTARSREDLYFLSDEARRQQKNEEQLAAYGGWGMAGRFGMGIVDPGMLLLAMGTGGMGAGAKVAQIGDALKIASTTKSLAPLGAELAEMQSTGFLTRMAYGTATNAAENAAIQSALQQGDANRDGTDVALAVLQGIAIHGVIGGLHTRSEMAQIASLSGEYQNRFKLAQLSDKLDEQRTSLIGQLAGGEGVARAAEGDLMGRVGGFMAANHGPIDDYPAFRRTLESGGNASAHNSKSTATGADQFLDKTWIDTVSQAKPQWAEGLSREQLLDLRKDPAKSGEMADFLDKQNAAHLEKSGAPVNVYTLYAAHHFGPQRAVEFAKAADDVLMDKLFPAAVLEANPYLKGKTKAEVIANWTERARKGGVDMDTMLGRSGITDAEGYRTVQVTDFDADATADYLRQLNADPQRLKQLDFEAGTALRPSDVRKLERALDLDDANLRENHGTPLGAIKAQVGELQRSVSEMAAGRDERLAKAREQDVAVHGPSVDAPAVVKLRERSVDQAIAEAQAPLKAKLKELQKTRQETRVRVEGERADKVSRLGMHKAALESKAEVKRVRAAQQQHQDLRNALGLHEQRTGLRDELTASRPRRETLDQLDNVGKVATGVQEARTTGTFGSDTLSAAKAIGYSDDVFPGASGAQEAVPQMKLAKLTNMANKGTFAGVLRGSDIAAVRDNFGRLVGNTLGNADGSAVAEGASEMATLASKKFTGHFNTAVKATYGEWMKEQGIPLRRYYNRQVRAEFMNEVGLHIRGQESESKAVQAMAARVSKLFADILKEAKEAGVQGFESVETNANYLPRVFNFARVHELEQRFGSDQLSKLIAEGMKETNPELPPEIAAKAGAHYVQKMRELRIGNDAGVLAGMTFDDIGYLRSFLTEAGVSGDELEQVVARFAEKKNGEQSPKGEGSFRNAKRRSKFDENFAMDLRVRGGAGETERVRISDLLDSNVEGLVGRYVRTVTGHTALAKIGIRSAAEWVDRYKAVANALEGHPDAEAILEKGQAAYDIVAGKPLEKAGFWSEMLRTTRDITYATQMENAGLANLPDLGALLAAGNLRYTFKHLMNLREMFPRDADGRLKSELWREQEEWMGIGTDYLNNTVFSSYDVAGAYQGNAEATLGRSVLSKAADAAATVSHAARVTGRAVTVGSGMAGLNAFSQRAAAMNILLRLKDDLFGRGSFNKTRMAALGIDDAMGKRIAAEMKKHTEWAKGELGGDIRKVNWADWTDLEARDSLLYAVNKEARKNIQEDDLGDNFLWQHKSLGKFLSQFRRFALTGYTKQFLRSLNERDAESVTRNAMQLLLAGGAYYAKTEAQLAGMQAAGIDSDKVEKWKQQNMGWSPTGRAAVRNAGFMFLLPDVYDSTVGWATGEPLFDFRNSGNSTNLIGGVPGIGLLNNLSAAGSAITQDILRGDRQFKQKDLRAIQALIPFGNHLAVAPLFASIAQELPETDDDDDKDHAKWFWQ